MIKCQRYPHVRDLLFYYAEAFEDSNILDILNAGISTEEQAASFSHFIWKMADQMREDSEAGKVVLGDIDNSDMLADVHYEVRLYMCEKGFEPIWEKISDEA